MDYEEGIAWNQCPSNVDEAIVAIESLLAWQIMNQRSAPYESQIVLSSEFMLDLCRKVKFLYERFD